MFDALQFENFRCFRDAKVRGLSRINVLAGRNASGKTAFLEAIYLAAGASSELGLRLRGWRGFPLVQFSNVRGGTRALWKDLFHNLDETGPIRLTIRRGESTLRSLEISYSKTETLVLPLQGVQNGGDATSQVPISFLWKDAGGREGTAQPRFTPQGFVVPPAGDLTAYPGAFYSSVTLPSPEEGASWFSDLSVQGFDKDFSNEIHKVFPMIADLSIQVHSGSAAIFASVSNVREKLPVNYVSAGISKLISYLLAIINNKGGFVCIDEIENGLHYGILESMWRLIDRFAEQHDVQIFASTHSKECLEAAVSSIGEAPNRLSFIRMDRKDGVSVPRRFGGTALTSALKELVEVR